MVDLTIRLAGDRELHLVRHIGDAANCHNRAAHRVVEVAASLQAEIERAILHNATLLATVREIVADYVSPLPINRVVDAELLKQFGWLLQTDQLVVIECIEVRRGVVKGAPQIDPLPPGVQPKVVPLEDPKTWIEIELLTDKGKPVPHQRYRIKFPDGRVEEGTLDDKGRAKFTNLDPGMCDISFVDIHAKEWKGA